MAIAPVLMVLYDTDAAEMRYSDGSCLWLSPCGASFIHQESAGQDHHPLHKKDSVQQRTQFVTSRFRRKVLHCLDFRNRFAERPYLCRALLKDDDVVDLYASIREAAWPESLKDARSKLDYFKNGSVRLISEDEFASLLLSPHQKDFTVCYLSKTGDTVTEEVSHSWPENPDKHSFERLHDISGSRFLTSTPINFSTVPEAEQNVVGQRCHRKGKSKHQKQRVMELDSNVGSFLELLDSEPGNSDRESSTGKNEMRDKPDDGVRCEVGEVDDARQSPSCRQAYSWTTKYFSVNACPQAWQYPLKLAQQALDTSFMTSSHPAEPRKGVYVTSDLPQPLPLNCAAPHLHRWEDDDLLDSLVDDNHVTPVRYKLKVLVIGGVVYRITYFPMLSIMEIHPGDGSVLISYGSSGLYFSHIYYDNGQIVEKTYSVKSPPPEIPNSAYSVAHLITRGYRLLSKASEASVSEVCWKHVSMKPLKLPAMVLLEECSVRGLGRFSAYSNGWAHAVFEDRTILNLQYDFSPRVRMFLRHSFAEDEDKLKEWFVLPCQSSNYCRLLLPTGRDIVVDINEPHQYRKYVDAAVEWGAWVNSSPSQRRVFYRQPGVTEQILSVQKELKKIHCFDCACNANGRGPLQLICSTDIISNTVLNKLQQTPDSAFYEDSLSPFKPLLPSEGLMDQNCVKAALLMTNKVINDIDHLLDRRKKGAL